MNTSYILITTHGGAADLAKKVNTLLRHGWQLYGAPGIGQGGEWFQAMTKDSD